MTLLNVILREPPQAATERIFARGAGQGAVRKLLAPHATRAPHHTPPPSAELRQNDLKKPDLRADDSGESPPPARARASGYLPPSPPPSAHSPERPAETDRRRAEVASMSIPLRPGSAAGEDLSLADALGGVIDRALERHPAGETFVYGIHQHVGPGVLARLRERYLAAGWGKVTLREGATGTHLLILTPRPPQSEVT